MSIPNIRNALEAALAGISPAIDIVHENQAYDPIAGQPYCEAYLLPAEPGNTALGSGYHREQGAFQINLQYPPLVGTLDAAMRGEQVRALFRRGATFTDGGVKVQIDKTPEIGQGKVEGDRWKLVCRIRWHADVFS
jgi:hypothetical protein